MPRFWIGLKNRFYFTPAGPGGAWSGGAGLDNTRQGFPRSISGGGDTKTEGEKMIKIIDPIIQVSSRDLYPLPQIGFLHEKFSEILYSFRRLADGDTMTLPGDYAGVGIKFDANRLYNPELTVTIVDGDERTEKKFGIGDIFVLADGDLWVGVVMVQRFSAIVVYRTQVDIRF
jgi:hypothetical protein